MHTLQVSMLLTLHSIDLFKKMTDFTQRDVFVKKKASGTQNCVRRCVFVFVFVFQRINTEILGYNRD